MMITIFKDLFNSNDTPNYESLETVKERIRLGSSIDKIELIRLETDKEKAKKIKYTLPCILFSGKFSARNGNSLIEHSGLCILDFDNIPTSEFEGFNKEITYNPHIIICFKSPSGNGLKAVIKIPKCDKESHRQYFKGFEKQFQYKYFDSSNCNVDRVCFESFDPDIYYNPSATEFVEASDEESYHVTEKIPNTIITNELEIIERIMKWWNKNYGFEIGNRNNNLFKLASAFSTYGINQTTTIAYVLENIIQGDFSKSEAKTTIKSAYERGEQEFGTKYFENNKYPTTIKPDYVGNYNSETMEKLNNNNKNEQIDSKEIISKENPPKNEYLLDTPTIPKFVFENLPPLLFEACKAFKTEREMDIFLTASLTVLSGCLPSVSGIYNGSKVNANLYSFIVAPAASGKGVMKWAKQIGMDYHKSLRASAKIANDNYEGQMIIFNQNKCIGEKPIPPPNQTLFSPADTSKSKLIEVMNENDGSLIIFETEADTLSGSIGKEWGGFSDLFRKAFHHEPYSFQRKTGNQLIELDYTKLSFCLSGTPMQVQRLIPNAEDGLLSRIMFYAFKVDAVWQDVSPESNKVPLDDFFADISLNVKSMILNYEKEENIDFTLQKHQWEKLNDIFRGRLETVKKFVSEDALSVVKRLGLINFRIAMILSILRKYNCGLGTPIQLACEDIDFDISIELTNIYLEHALIIFGSFSNQNYANSNKKSLFFEKLKPEFKRNDANELGKLINISEKTVHNYLTAFEKQNLLISPTHGFFKKI